MSCHLRLPFVYILLFQIWYISKLVYFKSGLFILYKKCIKNIFLIICILKYITWVNSLGSCTHYSNFNILNANPWISNKMADYLWRNQFEINNQPYIVAVAELLRRWAKNPKVPNSIAPWGLDGEKLLKNCLDLTGRRIDIPHRIPSDLRTQRLLK